MGYLHGWNDSTTIQAAPGMACQRDGLSRGPGAPARARIALGRYRGLTRPRKTPLRAFQAPHCSLNPAGCSCRPTRCELHLVAGNWNYGLVPIRTSSPGASNFNSTWPEFGQVGNSAIFAVKPHSRPTKTKGPIGGLLRDAAALSMPCEPLGRESEAELSRKAGLARPFAHSSEPQQQPNSC